MIRSLAWVSVLCAQVPTGHVWLQGDNVLNSTDSRDYGPVPMALVRGRVFCKVRGRSPVVALSARNARRRRTHLRG